MARYEYNSTAEELDVTVGQAFQYESLLDRYAAMSRPRQTVIVNDTFKIVPVPCKAKYAPCYKDCDSRWHYFYNDGARVQFASVDEAMQYIEALTALLQWMGGIGCPSFAAEVSDEEAFEQMMWEAREEKLTPLTGLVIYYTDLLDKCECVGRLISFDRDGMWLEDPAPPTHPQWFPHSMVANITRGRQTGWD